MKIFTKSVFAAIALMAGVTTANAQDEWMDPEQWVEVVPEMWFQWGNPDDETHCTKDAEMTGEMMNEEIRDTADTTCMLTFLSMTS